MWLPPYIPPSLNRGPSDPNDSGPSTLWLSAVLMGTLALCILGILFLSVSK